MITETYTIPSHFLSALINTDESGLTDEESAALDKFVDDNITEGHYFMALSADEKDDVGFCHYHDMQPYGVLAADCHKVTFNVSPVK